VKFLSFFSPISYFINFYLSKRKMSIIKKYNVNENPYKKDSKTMKRLHRERCLFNIKFKLAMERKKQWMYSNRIPLCTREEREEIYNNPSILYNSLPIEEIRDPENFFFQF